jgi:hypothetical protein
MTRSYYDKDLKLLWGLSAARCAFPKCQRECVHEETEHDPTAIIGKIAHIVAHSSIGPRADPSYPENLRDRYENLILLCPTHHDTVDVQPNTYSAADLRRWKSEHETWVRLSLSREIPNVGFAELEVVTQAILSPPSEPATIFTITIPSQKIARNRLTSDIASLIAMGLSKAKEVERFVEHVASLDEKFPERLKAGFVKEYLRLREAGFDGDALFEALHQFSIRGSSDLKQMAAGLAILTYLFEKCEVFEP